MDSVQRRTSSTGPPPASRHRPPHPRASAPPTPSPATSAPATRRRLQAQPKPTARPAPSSSNPVSLLAADLHDRIAQSLWSADAEIECALATLPPESDEAREHLVAGRRIIDDAYRDVRLTIGALRANLPFQRDLSDALKSRLTNFTTHTGIATTFLPPKNPPSWSRFVQLHVLAIVQQGLDNVARHAMASQVSVALERALTGWSLTVRDNGRGFDLAAANLDSRAHYGLTIMRERAESFQGSFAIQSVPGEGTILTISIPDTAPLRV